MAINAPREVIQTQIATHNAASPVGAEVMSHQAGRSRVTGEAVQTSSAQADLTDALEELGMAAATRGKTDLDKMKLRKGAGSNFEALGRIAEYYDKLPDMPSDQHLRSLVKQFQTFEEAFRAGEGGGQGGGHLPTAEDLRELLRGFDGDIAHQFAALETVRDLAARSGASESYLGLLDELRREMRQPDAAREIMAGFASARPASQLADQLASDPAVYRESYRQLLRESPDLGRVFDALGAFDLSSDFETVLDSFMRTAGEDVARFGPSTERSVIGDVLRELSALKSLRTVLDMSLGMRTALDRMHPPGAGEVRPDGQEITSRFLHFAGAPSASVADAERIIAGFDQARPSLSVSALNMLRDLHAQIPATAIRDDAARLHQSRVLLTLSDRLVAAEDAAYSD